MSSRILNQALGTFIGCYLCMSVGFISAWPSSTVQMFASGNTTLDRPMTTTEQALFGSLFAVTAVVCTPLTGYLLDCLGRKKCCVLFALPQVVSWALILVSNTVELVLLSVCISGVGGCLFTIVPLFISEISQENIRGAMIAGVNVFYGIGIMLSYIFGGYMSYVTMNYSCLCIAIVGVILLLYIKETPTYLMTKGLEQKAAESAAFYRNTSVNDKLVLEEIEAIRRTLTTQMNVAAEEETLQPDKRQPKVSLLQFIKNSNSTRRGISVVLVLSSLSLFQGLAGVQVYAQPLFDEAMPKVSGNLMSIFFGLLNTVAGFIGAYLVEIYGRRSLLLYSSSAAGVSCVAVATQAQFGWGPSWLSAVFLYLYCIAYTFGAGTVPYILMAEYFLPEVKGFMMMVSQEWAWICNFLVVFILSVMVSSFGIPSVFYLFSISCLLCVIFCYYYVPETKGLPVDVIQTLRCLRMS